MRRGGEEERERGGVWGERGGMEREMEGEEGGGEVEGFQTNWPKQLLPYCSQLLSDINLGLNKSTPAD